MAEKDKQNRNKRPLRITNLNDYGNRSPSLQISPSPSTLSGPRNKERQGKARPSSQDSLSSAHTPGNRRMQGTAPRTSGQRAEHQQGQEEGRGQGSEEGPLEPQAWTPRESGDTRAESALGLLPPPPRRGSVPHGTSRGLGADLRASVAAETAWGGGSMERRASQASAPCCFLQLGPPRIGGKGQ